MGSLIVAYIIMAIIVPYPPYPGTVAGGPVG
jgi:phage shock protein PspC (stress-responsive transcriptional regulator)